LQMTSQNVWNMSLLWHFFKGWSRNRIRVKSRIRIRIKVRIHNTSFGLSALAGVRLRKNNSPPPDRGLQRREPGNILSMRRAPPEGRDWIKVTCHKKLWNKLENNNDQ
jgi:hypothetical protein